MVKMNLNISVLCVIGISALYTVNAKIVVCYYGTWATYRSGLGKFDVENIDTNLCTHAVYTFVGITAVGTVVSLDPYLDLAENWGRDNFRKFTALKNKNANLKTLLAVGGWNEASAKYSVMAANPSLRKNFVTSALKMVRDHNFDGLDFDWEYPNRRDSVHGQADVENLTQLLKELREEFDNYGLMVTAAVASVEEMASLSYDIPAIVKYLDFIGIMTYDMYGPWDPVTGHNSPVHAGEGDENADQKSLYTFENAIDFWLKSGCPPEKLIVGVPFYGRTFTLTDANVNSVRAPASGVGIAGPYTATHGIIGYNEFCYKLKTDSWTVKYDSLAEVPYAFLGQNWVSYDDANSVAIKVKYANNLGLGGVMAWSIETDDFQGMCGGGINPLLNAIHKALGNEITESTVGPIDSSSNSPSSQVPGGTTTAAPNPSPTVVCKEEGFMANPQECTSYFVCIKDAAKNLIPIKQMCPSELYWDQAHLYCNYPDLVDCLFCYKLKTDSWTVKYDSLAEVPYAFLGQNWVSYDDANSVAIKVKYANNLGLGGVMAWSIETDDFQGMCGGGINPLLNAIHKALGNEITESTVGPIDSSSNSPSSQVPGSTTTAAPNPSPTVVCKEEGFMANPQECTSYFVCIKDAAENLIPIKQMCPNELYWDQAHLYCNYPDLVDCLV